MIISQIFLKIERNFKLERGTLRSKIKLAILMLIFPLLVVPQISTAQTSASENRGTVKLVEFHWTSIPPEKEYIGSNEILEAHYRFVFQPWCEEGVLEDLIANITDIADMPTELNWKGVPPEEYAGDNWIAWEYGDISSGEETPLLEWVDHERVYEETLGFSVSKEVDPVEIQTDDNVQRQEVIVEVTPNMPDRSLTVHIDYEEELIQANIVVHEKPEGADVRFVDAGYICFDLNSTTADETYRFAVECDLTRKEGVEGWIQVIPRIYVWMEKTEEIEAEGVTSISKQIEVAAVKLSTSNLVNWYIPYGFIRMLESHPLETAEKKNIGKLGILETHSYFVSPETVYVDSEEKELYYSLKLEVGCSAGILDETKLNITDVISPYPLEPPPKPNPYPFPKLTGENWLFWDIGTLVENTEFEVGWIWRDRAHLEPLGFSTSRGVEPKIIPAEEESIVQTVTIKVEPLEKDKWLIVGIEYGQELVNVKVISYNHEESARIVNCWLPEWSIPPPLSDVYIFTAEYELTRKPEVSGPIIVFPGISAGLRVIEGYGESNVNFVSEPVEVGNVKVMTENKVDMEIGHELQKGLQFRWFESQVISATVDIKPDKLNLKRNGRWVTCYIELPKGYDVKDIDVKSIRLSVAGKDFCVDLEAPITIGDYDEDGISDLMVKFDNAAIRDHLQGINDNKVEFTMTGRLQMTAYLQGSDIVRIISS